MKKITAILIAILLVLTFVACVDHTPGDDGGDVKLPGTESSSASGGESSSNGNQTGGESSSNGNQVGVESTPANTGSVDDNGNIDLPIDWFD